MEYSISVFFKPCYKFIVGFPSEKRQFLQLLKDSVKMVDTCFSKTAS